MLIISISSFSELALFFLYRLIVGLFFYISLPILFLLVLISGKHREGLLQRFGFYPLSKDQTTKKKTVWLHAASVGEVQAARAVIREMQKRLPSARYVVTTMTIHGKRIAKSQLDENISCFLAPLDVPWIVNLALRRVRPDIYICIETELWPVLLYVLSRKNVRICLVNGRMSEKSFNSYKKIRPLLRAVLMLFDRMTVISNRDRERYLNLGAARGDITVEGNVKYDLEIPKNSDEILRYYKELMRLRREEVFLAGSTHTGEEELLLPLYQRLREKQDILFIIAPRHVERIAEIEKKLTTEKISYQLHSDLKKGDERKGALILIDNMGELAHLYSIAHFVFCGGSLVERGGHNLMEAALWQKAVFFGPSISDFLDAADLLESVKGGFRVKNIAELEELILYFGDHRDEYKNACYRAGDVAKSQQGCARRQVDFILQSFAKGK